MLHMSVQRSGGFASIRCTGRIVFGDDLHHLKVATWSQGTREVMLDLSRVGLIDAAGLGALVELHQRFQSAGGTMKLVNPTRFVSHVFKITQLDTVFHIVRTGHIEVARTDGGNSWSKFSQLAMTTVPATAGLVVLISGLVIDRALAHFGTSVSIVDDVVAGSVAAILVLLYERRRRHDMNDRREVNRLMNHHVRNALHVITYATHNRDEAQQKLIESSVARIEWSLTEILPGHLKANRKQ